MGFRKWVPALAFFAVLSLLLTIACSADDGLLPSSSTLPAFRSDEYCLIRGSYSVVDNVMPLKATQRPESLKPSVPEGGWKNVTTSEALSLDFPKMVLADAYHVLTGPARWDGNDWLLFSGAALSVGALGLLDRQVKEEFRRVERHNDGEWAQQIRKFGGPYSFATLGLFYAGGLAFDDQKAKSLALDGAAASALASGLVVPFLKFSVGRDRPSAHNGTYAFRPFSSDRASFPSGESCQAFAVASVVASHYDQLWIKSVSYGLASTVALARLYLDGHFLSDVAAGAMIGTVIGRAVVHHNEKGRAAKEKKRNISVVPYFNGTAGGVLLMVS